MKKLISMLSLFVVVLAGCGSTAASNAFEYSGACDGDNPQIGLVTDTGGINDKSFNQGTWEGMETYCNDSGITGTYIETTDSAQRLSNLEKMASEEGIEVVVASGYTFANDIFTVANEYPDVNFILIDAEPTDPDTGEAVSLDNVVSYYFNEQQAGYIVGYIAGSVTETNRVGFVGGEAIPPVQKFGYGYVQGVNDANPEATVDYQYAGTFDDASIGNTTAQTMISQGADVVFASAGGTNDGIVKAGIDSTKNGTPVWVIGVDSDMYDDGLYTDADGNEASVILTSAMKMVNMAAYNGIEDNFNGEFPGGEVITLGYEDEGVGLPAENPNLDDALATEAKEALESKGEVATDPKSFEGDLSVTINGSL